MSEGDRPAPGGGALRDRLLRLLVTLGVGASPVAPGTLGTAVVAILWIALVQAGLDHVGWCVVTLLPATALSVALTPTGERILGMEDPGGYVLDEAAGFLVTLSFSGSQIEVREILLAFVFFRVFDIAKPWPVRWLENRGGWFGVTLDDLAAGVYGGFCLAITGILWLR